MLGGRTKDMKNKDMDERWMIQVKVMKYKIKETQTKGVNICSEKVQKEKRWENEHGTGEQMD